MTTTTISLRLRLFLAFGVILFLALGVPAYYLHQNLGRTSENEARDGAVRDLRSVEWMLSSGSFDSLEQVNEALRELGARMDIRISFMTLDGRVLTDSGVTAERVESLENHLGRPEVIQALGGEIGLGLRYSDTLAQELLYAAIRTQASGALPEGIVRIARPQSQIRKSLDSLYGQAGWVYGLGVVLAFGLVSLTSRQIGRAISSLAQAAADIGQGEPGKRIRFSPSTELTPLVVAFNNMVERIESNMQTIVKQKMESEAVLNGMKAGLIVLDGNGRILRGNYAAQEIFPGLSTFAGRKPMELSLLQDLQDACDQALRKRREGDFSQIGVVVSLVGGRSFEVSIVPIKGDAELGVIMVFHDITEIKRVEQIRRDFVANVSHELRTPLTSIKGYAETLVGIEKYDPEQTRSFLEVILRNANHMNTMLDELLQLSRLEHGKQRVDRVAVDPASALYSAWKSCHPLHKNIEFVNELGASTPAVRANFEQLVQVFRNILENAVKYVPEETAVIRVHARPCGNDLVVSVEDNGPGIPAEDQARIFERFYRVEKDRNSSIGGTGLGLAICRHIMANHGGGITVQSPVPETGIGSRFIITLPLAGQISEE
ncbi:MAG: PAS domain S-box protein [Desulfomicrobium sp.]|nr:PAS domain S-box protein [Desulfomicrobium sp.]